MAVRSYADVPNRIVRIFLQEAGRQYDDNRGLPRFRTITPELLTHFDGACAYCGARPPSKLVEEHLVPMNRESAGLHAWGNIVPACKKCNDIKAGHSWLDHPSLDASRRSVIETYIARYNYEPDVSELFVVLSKLYELANVQTRALVDFALVASKPYLSGMHTIAPPTATAHVDGEGSPFL